jgi:hypothetical protein
MTASHRERQNSGRVHEINVKWKLLLYYAFGLGVTTATQRLATFSKHDIKAKYAINYLTRKRVGKT